jgi:hypothetical protein
MRVGAQHQTGWFTSSFSGPANVNCVEVRLTEAAIDVRDSKNRRGPQVHFGSVAWQNFLDQAASQ